MQTQRSRRAQEGKLEENGDFDFEVSGPITKGLCQRCEEKGLFGPADMTRLQEWIDRHRKCQWEEEVATGNGIETPEEVKAGVA